jgi:hypothetical protein
VPHLLLLPHVVHKFPTFPQNHVGNRPITTAIVAIFATEGSPVGNIFNFYGTDAAANAAKSIVLKSPLYEMAEGI